MPLPPKCSICHLNRSVYLWQPFGPDESPLLFARPGYHYRGFPTVRVCEDCRRRILEGKPVRVELIRKGETWLYKEGKIEKVERKDPQ